MDSHFDVAVYVVVDHAISAFHHLWGHVSTFVEQPIGTLSEMTHVPSHVDFSKA